MTIAHDDNRKRERDKSGGEYPMLLFLVNYFFVFPLFSVSFALSAWELLWRGEPMDAKAVM